MIVFGEVIERDNGWRAKLLKAARLRYPAYVEDINFRHPHGFAKPKPL